MTKPTPAAGQVLVRVAATSVNTVDTMIRRMGQAELPLSPDLPAVLGMDFAGTVDAVGPDVTGFAPGDEVMAAPAGLVTCRVHWRKHAGRCPADRPQSCVVVDARGGGFAACRHHRL